MLPAHTVAREPDQLLAPWEQSPDEFAVAPAMDDQPPWPAVNTGSMYVWNPAIATSPVIAVNDQGDDEDED